MEAIFKREIILDKTICRAFGVFIFIILTALAAFVRIPLPFTPVPLTLQTLFVLLSAAILGSRLGAFSQLGYILLGLVGFPLFTGAGTGLLYLSGPTAGYLIGFIIAAFSAGKLLTYTKENRASTFLAFLIADFILLSCGTIWLKLTLNISIAKAFLIGFIPFIIGDILKVFVACLIYLKLKPRIREIF